jgi:Domain of unknown function (DUF4389)
MTDTMTPARTDFGGPPAPQYPVTLDVRYEEKYHRWLPLVKWLLLIPHLFVLGFLWIGGLFAVVAAWFAVLFTGKYPPGIFNFLVGLFRWSNRVAAYNYFMTDDYPAFSLSQQPNDPVLFDIEYPTQGIARWRPLLHWLMVIPYAIAASIIGAVVGVIQVIAFFTILFTQRFPRELFNVAVIGLRWNARAAAYYLFMTERYPPFVWA